MKSFFKLALLISIIFAIFGCTFEKEVSVNKSDVMSVHFIDVGQGDSVLVSSDGMNMLIDAGENNKGDVVVDYLNNLGITRLDYVIGTHPHSDHIGGLDTVINNFEVKNVIMPNKAHNTKTFEDVLMAIKEKGLRITRPHFGDTYTLGSSSFTIISPDKDYGKELNDCSVGIKLVNGNNSFVFCGDAEKIVEEDMCNSGIDISADVLKLNHHGSSTSNSEEFLKAVSPKYAVICCGKNNSYGHPHKDVIDRVNKLGIKYLTTAENGNIVFESDGTKLTVRDSIVDTE